jgi:hypothetical protein
MRKGAADDHDLHGHFSHAVDQKAAAIVRALPPVINKAQMRSGG